LLITGTYLGFRASSYRDLKRIGPMITATPKYAMVLIVGSETAKATGLRT
jgi:hypothetical protein